MVMDKIIGYTMKTLYFIRGVPGSGKSSLAESLATMSGAYWIEADYYFLNEDGEYKFDPTRLKEVHSRCQNFVLDVMKDSLEGGWGDIIVSNTFTQEWEMKPYIQMAEEYGYRVVSLIVENRHGNKSVHGVPDEKVQQMRDRFEIAL
jgi:predicted kinase